MTDDTSTTATASETARRTLGARAATILESINTMTLSISEQKAQVVSLRVELAEIERMLRPVGKRTRKPKSP